MKIRKLKALNFKRFETLDIDFEDNLNVLIGDNESGKSSILLAIDLVLSGSRSKVETLGLDSLFNFNTINNFFSSNQYSSLPQLTIEIYFSELNDPYFHGRNNLDNTDCYGLYMVCEPKDELSAEIIEILSQNNQNFPFEYYSISFHTFAGQAYSGFKKYFKHLLLDNTQINNEYATKSYIKTLYNNYTSIAEKNRHSNKYRYYKNEFRERVLNDLNSKTGPFAFSIKNNSKSNLESDLTITENDIDIDNRGKGRQCFIKTEFALQKKGTEIDFILLEEPENHLSHSHMKKLINRINDSKNKQIFIATHNSLISTRLDLRNTTLLNSSSNKSISLKSLKEDTAKFFMKAPDNNILEYILSEKVILVEGDSEYIMMNRFCEIVLKNPPEEYGIHIISVGGTSFKRYLDVAVLLDIKTLVIRDNDENYQVNCVERYSKYLSDKIKVFSEEDNSISTFEISMYNNNTELCEELFSKGRKTLTTLEYMLSEKADCAFRILDKKHDSIKVPQYIKNGILWLTKE
ncbi:TOPRIM nucleotidyl transferase/hydrolase domain-containing protein [Flavobacterium sp. ST-75]|uniref:TOPRIM nucleotidyl transferase/hydrolase domain-containing protein n=1 Tax=Flavobacterium rhizophilum TaxID=3163296 RepID=A0ABW8YED7_9FLAO